MGGKDSFISKHKAKLLSPFRYPGGKTWLVPYICKWLDDMESKPGIFVEPFAGGSIVGLNVGHKQLAQQVKLVELDEDVAAVWRIVFGGGAADLAERIETFDISRESVIAELSSPSYTLEDKAFKTILRNRVSRGGILASGAGILREGEDGKGVGSRWYPQTLSTRIREVERMRDCITFVSGDGLDVLKQYTWPTVMARLIDWFCQASSLAPRLLRLHPHQSAAFFIDPPYTVGGKKAGERLYQYHRLDHEELFRIAGRLRGDFVMTYSSNAEVRALAECHGFDTEEIPMRSSHHTEMNELLIGRDLSWVRRIRNS